MAISKWEEWGKHVLAELERLDKSNRECRNCVARLQTEVSNLKLKSGIWGVVGAAIPILVGVLIYLVTKT